MKEAGFQTTLHPGNCPWCGYHSECATYTLRGRVAPKPGDVSVCIKCARPAVFAEVGLRRPTESELAVFQADPDVIRAQAAIRQLNARKG